MINIIIYLKKNWHEFLTFPFEKPFLPHDEAIFTQPESIPIKSNLVSK